MSSPEIYSHYQEHFKKDRYQAKTSDYEEAVKTQEQLNSISPAENYVVVELGEQDAKPSLVSRILKKEPPRYGVVNEKYVINGQNLHAMEELMRNSDEI